MNRTLLLTLSLSSLFLYTACDKEESEEKADKAEDKADDKDEDKADDKADDKAEADKPEAKPEEKKPEAKPEEKPEEAAKPPAEGLGVAPTWESMTDAPVEVTDFKAKIKAQKFAARTGQYMTLDFKLKRVKDPGERPGLDVKGACQVGDQVVADVGRPFGQIEKMEDGESKQVDSLLFMSGAMPEKPSMCEFTIFFKDGFGKASESKILKEMCWNGTDFADGKCADLKRPETTDLVKIVDVEPKIEKIKYGDAKGKKQMVTNYTVLVGGTVDDDDSVELKAACMVGTDKMVDRQRMFSDIHFMGPGEAILSTATSYLKGLEADPSSCDLTFQVKSFSEDDGDVVGEFCFKDGAVSDGKCG